MGQRDVARRDVMNSACALDAVIGRSAGRADSSSTKEIRHRPRSRAGARAKTGLKPAQTVHCVTPIGHQFFLD